MQHSPEGGAAPLEAAGPQTYEEIAGIVDFALLDALLSQDDIHRGCEMAREYGVASVLVRPSDGELAVRWLQGSGVKVGAVVGYPHGHGTTPAKLYEVRDLLRRGVQELEATVNLGKLRSRQFADVETELLQMADACREAGASLRVSLESGWLAPDLKLIALKCCKRTGVDFAVTGGEHGAAVTVQEVAYLKQHLGFRLQLKAAGGVTTLEQVQALLAQGAARVGTAAPAVILDAWRAELQARTQLT